MDSINKNQQEDNINNLSGRESIQKIKDLVKKANVCFSCTSISMNEKLATRPSGKKENG